MSCVTIVGQEVSARSMLPPSKRRLIGSLFSKIEAIASLLYNRRLLQQNLPIANIGAFGALAASVGKSHSILFRNAGRKSSLIYL